ncbi:hypothetical protein PYCCODRAFT_920488 [Trametes coccinea BRFM310]|uniref:Uncharacterized protein n=1 Tax=Trametes coccinea (strain BRFM310) TaxID=1353009 RepID=A0A1Y2J0J0_TRAC3|nr:hypothetical protein PYCCODRAFT_920488 [Trametes coccinea BRFM310]
MREKTDGRDGGRGLIRRVGIVSVGVKVQVQVQVQVQVHVRVRDWPRGWRHGRAEPRRSPHWLFPAPTLSPPSPCLLMAGVCSARASRDWVLLFPSSSLLFACYSPAFFPSANSSPDDLGFCVAHLTSHHPSLSQRTRRPLPLPPHLRASTVLPRTRDAFPHAPNTSAPPVHSLAHQCITGRCGVKHAAPSNNRADPGPPDIALSCPKDADAHANSEHVLTRRFLRPYVLCSTM